MSRYSNSRRAGDLANFEPAMLGFWSGTRSTAWTLSHKSMDVLQACVRDGTCSGITLGAECCSDAPSYGGATLGLCQATEPGVGQSHSRLA
jgi:hypothetical protein